MPQRKISSRPILVLYCPEQICESASLPDGISLARFR